MGELKDSGQRETGPTGMVREPINGSGRYDLISPIALKLLAIHYENGAKKYSPRNWEKGGKLSEWWNHAEIHMQSYLSGDREEDHLSAVVWNLFCIQHGLEMIRQGQWPEDLNDLPNLEVKPCLKKTI